MDRATVAQLTTRQIFELVCLCMEELMRRYNMIGPATSDATVQAPSTPPPAPATPEVAPACSWFCAAPFCQQRCMQRDPLHIDHLCPMHRHWKD